VIEPGNKMKMSSKRGKRKREKKKDERERVERERITEINFQSTATPLRTKSNG
jgi:hypothetical protein